MGRKCKESKTRPKPYRYEGQIEKLLEEMNIKVKKKVNNKCKYNGGR